MGLVAAVDTAVGTRTAVGVLVALQSAAADARWPRVAEYKHTAATVAVHLQLHQQMRQVARCKGLASGCLDPPHLHRSASRGNNHVRLAFCFLLPLVVFCFLKGLFAFFLNEVMNEEQRKKELV